MNPVEEYLTPLVGQYVWGVTWDSELSLRMSFGTPHLKVHEPSSSRPNKRIVAPEGQWFLWSYFAYWRISIDGKRVAKGGTLESRSPIKRILRATSLLEGQIVTEAIVKPKSGSLRLTFDLGARLDLRPISRKRKEEVWLLYSDGGGPVLSVRSDGKYTRDTRADDAEWISIA